MKNILIITLLALSIPLNSIAQLTSVKYKIQYNSATCNYDFFLVVEAGSATSNAQRFVQTGKLTLVVPTGSVVGTQIPNEPKLTTTLAPVAWAEPNITTNPAALPGFDFHDFNPPTTGTRYSSIAGPGDVLLFSLPISTTTCGTGMRLYINGTDPTSSDAGMGGNDYSNSFGMGGPGFTQIYNGNISANTAPSAPVISSMATVCNASSFTINVTASTTNACAGALTYAFTAPPAPATGTPQTGAASSYTINNPTVNDNGTYTVVVSDAKGCKATASKAYNTVTCVPLPIKLSSIEAIAKNCKAEIAWKSATEQSADHFEIQRSNDGREWKAIGSVKAAFENGGAYSYTDESPIAGSNQYRLKMYDQNGSFAYSQVRTINSDCGVRTEVLVYPTEVNNDVFIALPKGSEDAQVMLLNNVGQMISTRATGTGTQLQSFSMEALASGQYFVKVITKQEAKTYKIIRK